MPQKRTCIYCGGTGLTNEHVFPECFRRIVGDTLSTAKTPAGEVPIIAQELHDICRHCNNGPLSQLDTYICALNSAYFSKIVHPGDRVHFEYDFDLLLRAVLKISYNVARARKWPLKIWQEAAQYILGVGSLPSGIRLFLQLIIPTPLKKTNLLVHEVVNEVPPIPMRVLLLDMSSLPAFTFACSVSVFSYRFFVLKENMLAPAGACERARAKWLKGTKGAYELTKKGAATLYASSVTVLDDLKNNPTFDNQLAVMREMKSIRDVKKAKLRLPK